MNTAIDADVAVIGAGPAGCALALNLAPFHRVIVVDKGSAARRRVGESLPAAGGRLLRDMGLADEFLAQGHTPCHVMRSSWGEGEVVEQDALRNLDGHGWHLDRARFDAWLVEVAARRGAATLRDTRLLGVRGAPGHWKLDLARAGRPVRVRARALVDASGRDGVLARHVGGRRAPAGKLICGWVFGHDDGRAAGIAELHAEAEGWWYSAALPARRRLLAFYSDADLPAARAAHSASGLLMRMANVPQLRALLVDHRFAADGDHGFCAAHGAALEQPAGDGWLAVGDAALAFDPLSSQGLFNALYTGLAGAEALHRHLQGDLAALPQYADELARVQRTYAARLDACYAHERRWPDSAFWRRRQAPEPR
ncbi:flavin-dependent dehydrogenase [Pseudoduganella flava]|uniref:Flavin-dependent dehydrogenase n=1 Tax=Pseudoduganella flava TaxID=871742 RepID=A0A562PQ74_9BURK|nr:tryptophan 7-halogenase [Pseudoduganella flava]QGZ37781.1 NAD(P)/FAD-dependent oxidoreductase [Pseudoduganella flava]TWI46592.1 flavin-dependent dehydrogenase [Pseudoduganella flava]